MAGVRRPTKRSKIKNPFKSAARMPKMPNTKGQTPFVILRLQVLRCKNLLAKDRGGTSDPFVVVSILNDRKQTPVAKRTLNPIYAPKDGTFDFPIYLSLADRIGVVEIVVWDKDLLRKEYLGEVSLPLDDWFPDGRERAQGFDHPANEPMILDLTSTRADTTATGSVQIKLGFMSASSSHNLLEFEEIYAELRKRSRPSIVSAPPTEGVGTIRSHQFDAAGFQDDGLSSDSEGSDDEDEDFEVSDSPLPLSSSASSRQIARIETTPSVPTTTTGPEKLPELTISVISPTTPTDVTAIPNLGAVRPTPKAPGGSTAATPSSSSSRRFNPKNFVRRFSGLTGTGSRSSSPSLEAPAIGAPPLTQRSASEDKGFFSKSKSATGDYSSSSGGENATPTTLTLTRPRSPSALGFGGKRKESYYAYSRGNDIMGIVMLEIQGADNLPKLANIMHTGWDMDPFVVISFGKKVFRTRVIRHSRNPVWDEKMLLHVHRYEENFQFQFAVLDWDQLSSNDFVGEASLDLKELLDCIPKPDPITGLYPVGEEADVVDMKEFKLPLSMQKSSPYETKNTPVLKFRAKYQPYDALRQRFWRPYLRQYDADDTGAISQVELRSMLDSLGSTLTKATIVSFFTRFGKKPDEEELSIDQVVQCLEEELGRPESEKKHVDIDESRDTSALATPLLLASGPRGENLDLDSLDFSGPSHVAVDSGNDPRGPFPPVAMQPSLSEGTSGGDSALSGSDAEGYSSTGVVSAKEAKKKKSKFRGVKRIGKSKKEMRGDSSASDDSVERVINVKNCPLCHRARLNQKAEMDIVTHLAICASQDWNQVDNIMVGNFVTASQAQRKWYTKVIGKLSAGDYKLGANSANIIVQNRITGQLEEEKMQVYIRLGIRLLYKGASSRMEGATARRLLKSISIKQGIKYDDPESVKNIPAFVQFYNLNTDEILDPLDSFKTFNQFFYRKLRPDARPVDQPENPNRIVSGADSRLMTFETVSEATRLWIKGRDFTIAGLLGDSYKGQSDKYIGGALCILRLAPQDYHRYHSPVDGIVGRVTEISGEYYTVNPQAIRSTLDVYGENARKIVPIDSAQFGRVFAVCVGAMMVGSIGITVNEGEEVKRGQEFGYFAFGGSTIVLLFEKDKVVWDEDLLINSRAALETLVRVGMGIGNRRSA